MQAAARFTLDLWATIDWRGANSRFLMPLALAPRCSIHSPQYQGQPYLLLGCPSTIGVTFFKNKTTPF